jgi:hypothetical protein
MKRLSLAGIFCLLITACAPSPEILSVNELPPIYPDYANVTIPCNIAPLNFLLRNHPGEVEVHIKGSLSDMLIKGGHKVRFPLKKWRSLLETEQGRTVSVTVTVASGGRRIRYAPFLWHITSDKIDPYLSYRLIEPGYEVWNAIQLVERHIESFSERVIADNNLNKGVCMNCHIYVNQNPNLSFFHLRGENGGTILNREGRLSKPASRTEGLLAPLVYGDIHPSGRYGVFSTNIIMPAFHTRRGEQMEVYDEKSGLLVVDLDSGIATPFPQDTLAGRLRTFPVFSAGGNAIYYCEAPATPLPDSIRNLRYSLHKITFDPSSGAFGREVDTLFSASGEGLSACHPKASPDGRYLMYTVAAYGAFPIWHNEADLRLMDLQSGRTDTLANVNAAGADSYHSWSSGSRWFVFSSRRDDGLYTKPYFSHIDSSGIAGKPFLLPQRDPTFYDYNLKSFNIPELSGGKLPFSAKDVEQITSL